MQIDWSCLPSQALTPAQLYAVLALRAAVFVVEQDCPYQDVDGKDLLPATHHVMARDGDRLLACLRLLDDAALARTVIGRVCVEAAARGAGLGHGLMRQGLEAAQRLWPGRPVYLSAQSHLQAFYVTHGFTAVTAEYLEDGIPHIGMRRPA